VIKKTVLVLGASSDIGVELIKILVKKKYLITAHYNSNHKILSRIKKKYKNLKLIKKNFENLNEKNIKTFCETNLKNNYGIFVNLIGYVDNVSYEKFNLNNLINSIKINSIIPMIILKEILNKMIYYKFGRILNCSSIGVKFGGGKKSFNYSYSKHASEFIPSSIKKLAKKNILINNIRIGLTDTKIHNSLKSKSNLKKRILLIPSKKIADKKEIANYLFFLISEENSYMTNETVTVAGGE